jgi:hypothetical protein
MANITITNIGDEPRQLRPFRNAEKVTVQPGESILCDHDWVKANALAAYGDFYRVEDGGILPGLKEVLAFIDKATDAEKDEIITAAGGTPPAELPAEETVADSEEDDPEQEAEEEEAPDAETADLPEDQDGAAEDPDTENSDAAQVTEGGTAADGDEEPAPQQPAAAKNGNAKPPARAKNPPKKAAKA